MKPKKVRIDICKGSKAERHGYILCRPHPIEKDGDKWLMTFKNADIFSEDLHVVDGVGWKYAYDTYALYELQFAELNHTRYLEKLEQAKTINSKTTITRKGFRKTRMKNVVNEYRADFMRWCENFEAAQLFRAQAFVDAGWTVGELNIFPWNDEVEK